MRIQKIYIGYCAVTWTLWAVTLILCLISGNAYNVLNADLFPFARDLSGKAWALSMIPVHPVLFGISLFYSIRNKREGYTAYNYFSIILSTFFAVLLLGNYVGMCGV